MDHVRRYAHAYAFLFLCAANGIVWGSVVHAMSPDLRVTFLDVGQGDAILTVWTKYIRTSFG